MTVKGKPLFKKSLQPVLFRGWHWVGAPKTFCAFLRRALPLGISGLFFGAGGRYALVFTSAGTAASRLFPSAMKTAKMG
jgi:hypothetical protein